MAQLPPRKMELDMACPNCGDFKITGKATKVFVKDLRYTVHCPFCMLPMGYITLSGDIFDARAYYPEFVDKYGS